MSDQLLDRLVKKDPLVVGKVHMHFIGTGWSKSAGVWAVRRQGTVLCGTNRCHIVTVRIVG